MRRSLLFLLVLVPLAAAAPARAGELRLWACHGPNGAGLPFSSLSGSTGGATVAAVDGGCSATGGALRLAFAPQPTDGESAWLRFAVPSGVALRRVVLGRHAVGPGYVARTSSGELERAEAGEVLDEPLIRDAGGDYVELRVDCATACDLPDAGVNFSFAALTVRDDTAPTVTVTGLPQVATRTINLAVEASDAGVGVASAAASVDGTPVTTQLFDAARCRELSPSDGTIDLNLTLACTPAGRVSLELDTTAFANGEHRLAVTVTDGAGNTHVRDLTLRVFNPTPLPPPPPPAIQPAPPATVRPQPRVPTTRELVRIPRRLVVSHRGSLTLSVLCPAASPRPCRHQLALAAGGRDIATGTGTAQPGRRVRITLKLTRAARRQLSRRRAISATLILAGARNPAPVRLRT